MRSQRLASGYLLSRSTAQFLAIRSAASQRGLDVTEAEDDEALPQVTNRLGTRIEALVLVDHSRRYYWARDIAPGARFQPSRIEAGDAAVRLSHLVQDNQLAFPPGYDIRHSGAGYFRRYYNYNDTDTTFSAPSFQSSLLERSIGRACSVDSPGWRPGGYVAVTETSPETPLGYAAAHEEASFHVIVGQW